jgi:hypothetical protein
MYMAEIRCYVPCDLRMNLGITAVSTSLTRPGV